MPDDQDRQRPRRPKERPHQGDPAASDSALPTPSNAAPQSAPRRRTPAERTDPRQPVDFQAAAQRLTARAAQIARLKTEVERGAYQADPTETARAMERRSDA